ncbi:MAG: polyprenyl synthetase family protein [Armatimonadetes bacterium]|nr:polyprenyl synthetase family protein [Armatimonadota bacterium]
MDQPISGVGISPVDPFGEYRTLVASHADQVEAALRDICGDGCDQISRAALSAVEAGGKRLRPLVTLLSAKVFGEPNAASLDVAVGLEVLHLASLMHDDVVDEADLRRGKPAVRQLFGNRIAVLVGDYLAARAYRKLTNIRDWAYVDIMAHVVDDMASSEAAFARVDPFQLTEADCLDIARGKTAGLFGAACQLGAMSVGAPEPDCLKMREYGINLGLAFQIADDLLDVFGQAREIGKDAGRDVLTGQFSLPIVAALSSSNGHDVRRIIEDIGSRELMEDELQSALAALADAVETAGGKARAQEIAWEHVERSRAALAGIEGDAQALNALREIAALVASRDR